MPTLLLLTFSFDRDTMIVSSDINANIWKPNLKFENVMKYERSQSYGHTGSFTLWYLGYHLMEYTEVAVLKLFCNFDFTDFPFDAHECNLTYGDGIYESDVIWLNSAIVKFDEKETKPGEDPIVINSLPYPFEFQLTSLKSYEKKLNHFKHSATGMILKLERNSLGMLASRYYYPTGSFAILSLISFLINPDIVSNSYEFRSIDTFFFKLYL